MNNSDETTEFILPESTGDEVSEHQPRNESLRNFPVLPNLAILGIILFALFSAVIIPQTLSYLHQPPQTTAIIVPVAEEAPAAEPIDYYSDITLGAEAVHVFDIANQTVLYERNSQVALPLASITKLLTSLLSYELVTDDTKLTISAAAAAQQSGGTLQSGEVFAAKKLADFALISSYNSAAYTLADSVGAELGSGDPVAQFVSAMNVRAEELSLESFKILNPTGLDISATEAGAYGSAADVSKLVAYILKHYPEVLLPTTKPYTRLYNTAGDFHEADNTNDIITSIPNVLGSKTGYTDLSGGNLTVVFDAGYNHPIVVTVLGSTHSGRFADVEKLIAATQAKLRTQ